jgi:hypothetical protein
VTVFEFLHMRCTDISVGQMLAMLALVAASFWITGVNFGMTLETRLREQRQRLHQNPQNFKGRK